MTLLIDTPRWPWRGRLWAHLISDESLDELHEAARHLSLRWLSFGRDHYDVPDTVWPAALEVARHVDSRDIVRSLRASGLRVPGGKPIKTWRRVPGETVGELGNDVGRWLDTLDGTFGAGEREVLARPGESVIFNLFDADRRRPLRGLGLAPAGADRVVETVVDGAWSVELVLAQQSLNARSTTPTRPLR